MMGNMLNLNVEDGGSDQTKHYYQYIDICCKDWLAVGIMCCSGEIMSIR